MEEIIKELEEIGAELFRKYGTDSYTTRCRLHDAREKLKALTIPAFVGRSEKSPCECGSYYWVKCFTDDKYEPTVAFDYYDNGTMYFKFLNGAVRECRLVADYKKLN